MSRPASFGIILLAIAVLGAGGTGAYLLLGPDGTSTSTEPKREPAVLDHTERQTTPPVTGSSTQSPNHSPTPTATEMPEGQDFAALYDRVASGVTMVHATTCDGTGVGSAFRVGDDRMLTAAHVVNGAAAIAVMRDDGAAYQASVVGIDTATDTALLELHGNLDGHVFDITDSPTKAGESLAVIGHPLGDPLTITTGTTSRIDNALWPNFQLDVSVSPGNSGGPVVRAGGEIVGMLVAEDVEAEGLSYAVRADVLTDTLQNPGLFAPPAPADCGQPLGPEGAEAPDIGTGDDLHIAVAVTFANYFDGINSGDYQLAFEQLSPRLRGNMSVDEFAAGVETSYDFGFEVHTVEETADGASVWLEFVSLQAPEHGPEGEACTYWSLDYELEWHDGVLLIDRVTGHGDSSGHSPCT